MKSEADEKTLARNILVAPSHGALMKLAAGMFVEEVREAIAQRGRAVVALSGGKAPPDLFRLLAEPDCRRAVEWNKVHAFWGDERFVPPSDEKSNYRMANELLLSKVDIPRSNVHRYMTEQGTAEEVAAAYEREIREFFKPEEPRLDLNLLGLGANAHTASLFPHTAALHEQEQLVVSSYVEEIRSERLTFTAPFINRSRVIWFLVSGVAKAEAVRDVIAGPRDPERLPAQLIRPTEGRLEWLLDKEAASLLPSPSPK